MSRVFDGKYCLLFLQFIVLFGLLAVGCNAGHLGSYVDYAPTVHKTIEYAAPVHKTLTYAAPVAKAIYQPSPVYAKTVIEPEPYQYHNYHAYAPSAYQGYGSAYSHHGKTIATPHSYVSKYDTRYLGDDAHYKYAYPAAPVVPTIVKTPVVPTIVKTPIVSSVPVVKSYDSYDHSYDHSYGHPYGHSYGHSYGSPVLAKAAVSYSPAVAVSHATFESAHGNYAW